MALYIKDNDFDAIGFFGYFDDLMMVFHHFSFFSAGTNFQKYFNWTNNFFKVRSAWHLFMKPEILWIVWINELSIDIENQYFPCWFVAHFFRAVEIYFFECFCY